MGIFDFASGGNTQNLFGTLAAAGIGTGVGVATGNPALGFGAGMMAQNMFSQNTNLAYQKQLQNRMFERDDNAIQRRVADLRAAGLSPTLAAGSGAEAGPVISTAPSMLKGNPYDIAQSALSLVQQNENISNTRAQRDYIASQTLGQNLQNIGIGIANDRSRYELNSDMQSGTTSRSGATGRLMGDVTNVSNNLYLKSVNTIRGFKGLPMLDYNTYQNRQKKGLPLLSD